MASQGGAVIAEIGFWAARPARSKFSVPRASNASTYTTACAPRTAKTVRCSSGELQRAASWKKVCNERQEVKKRCLFEKLGGVEQELRLAEDALELSLG